MRNEAAQGWPPGIPDPPASPGFRGVRPALWKLGSALGALSAAAFLFDRLPMGREVRRQLWGLNQQNFHEFERKLSARKLPRLDARILGAKEDSAPPAAAMSPSGGFHAAPIAVSLSAPSGLPIRYTLDGSIPDRRSPLYSEPIRLESTAVVRARILADGMLPGEVATGSYLLEDRPSLPSLSLVVDPVNLWNKYTGIYDNPTRSGEEWIRLASFEYFAPRAGRAAWKSEARIRIHGGYSRSHPKKSFRITYPADSGAAAPAAGRVLNPGGRSGRKTVVLRSGGSNSRFRLRDELFAALYRRSGGIVSDFEPFTLYLNGEFWGIYNAREYVDGDFLAERFGPGEYELLAFDSKRRNDWATPVLGRIGHWKETLRFFERNEFSGGAAYAEAARLLDLDNTMDYWIHNIYAANTDWPYNNMTVFRKPTGDGKWRWISWDADAAFNYRGDKVEHRTLEWAVRDRVRNDLKHNYLKGQYEDEETFLVSTLFMRKLLANPGFRDAFIGRFYHLLNTAFRPERVEALLDSIVSLSRPDLERDWRRWGLSSDNYAEDTLRIREFIRKRPAVVRSHLRQHFGLEEAEVKVEFDAAGGTVTVNGVPAAGSPWIGAYPRGTPLRLTAVPHPGFAFAGWEGPGGAGPEGVLEAAAGEDGTGFRARFLPAGTALKTPIAPKSR